MHGKVETPSSAFVLKMEPNATVTWSYPGQDMIWRHWFTKYGVAQIRKQAILNTGLLCCPERPFHLLLLSLMGLTTPCQVFVLIFSRLCSFLLIWCDLWPFLGIFGLGHSLWGNSQDSWLLIRWLMTGSIGPFSLNGCQPSNASDFQWGTWGLDSSPFKKSLSPGCIAMFSSNRLGFAFGFTFIQVTSASSYSTFLEPLLVLKLMLYTK